MTDKELTFEKATKQKKIQTAIGELFIRRYATVTRASSVADLEKLERSNPDAADELREGVLAGKVMELVPPGARYTVEIPLSKPYATAELAETDSNLAKFNGLIGDRIHATKKDNGQIITIEYGVLPRNIEELRPSQLSADELKLVADEKDGKLVIRDEDFSSIVLKAHKKGNLPDLPPAREAGFGSGRG